MSSCSHGGWRTQRELRTLLALQGLNAFADSELDELLFFGREREREIVVANLIASRLTVLYGPRWANPPPERGGRTVASRAAGETARRGVSRWSDDRPAPRARRSPRRAVAPTTDRRSARSRTHGTAVTSTSSSTRRRSTSSTTPTTAGLDRSPRRCRRCSLAASDQRPRLPPEDSLAKLDRFTGRIRGCSRTRFGWIVSIAALRKRRSPGPSIATPSSRAPR